MKERVVLCRRKVLQPNGKYDLCCKPIDPKIKPNELEWCKHCRRNLPWWPR